MTASRPTTTSTPTDGDVIALTNADGEKAKTYAYDAFGEEHDISALDENPFRYCGEYYDTVSGTIYLRARYYDSSLGRFTQKDGWEFSNLKKSLSLNLYTYCWSNPVMFVDPSGHDAVYITRYGQDDGGLPVAGHSSVLLQAEDGLWYHVEFAGSNKDNASVRIDSTIKYDENGFTRVPKGFSSPEAFFEEKTWQSAYMHTYIEGGFYEGFYETNFSKT